MQNLSDNSLETQGVRSLVCVVKQYDGLTTLDISGKLEIGVVKQYDGLTTLDLSGKLAVGASNSMMVQLLSTYQVSLWLVRQTV